jgi:hypothetical protein
MRARARMHARCSSHVVLSTDGGLNWFIGGSGARFTGESQAASANIPADQARAVPRAAWRSHVAGSGGHAARHAATNGQVVELPGGMLELNSRDLGGSSFRKVQTTDDEVRLPCRVLQPLIQPPSMAHETQCSRARAATRRTRTRKHAKHTHNAQKCTTRASAHARTGHPSTAPGFGASLQWGSPHCTPHAATTPHCTPHACTRRFVITPLPRGDSSAVSTLRRGCVPHRTARHGARATAPRQACTTDGTTRWSRFPARRAPDLGTTAYLRCYST